jgi:hypothetical protein
MAHKPHKREWLLLERKIRKSAARKFNAPTKGVRKSIAEKNASAIHSILAKLNQQAA